MAPTFCKTRRSEITVARAVYFFFIMRKTASPNSTFCDIIAAFVCASLERENDNDLVPPDDDKEASLGPRLPLASP